VTLAGADGPAIREAAREEAALHVYSWFFRRAWREVEQNRPLLHNWHLDLVADELDGVIAGRVRELVICMPPGTAKSMLVSALLMPYAWLRRPEWRVLCTAKDPTVVARDSLRMRTLLRTPWYQGRVAELVERGEVQPWGLSPEMQERMNFTNSAGGQRMCRSIWGGITGHRFDGLIVDDPYDAKQVLPGVATPAQIAERMAAGVSIYDNTLDSRVEPKHGWKITIMQRLAEGDLAGELIKRGVRAVVLPMEHDPLLPASHRHPRDPRRRPGELLIPGRYDRAWCDARKHKPGFGRTWAAQYQQHPAPVGGTRFKREWFQRRYQGDPIRFARGLDELALTVDCAFKDSSESDYVVIQCWGRKGTNRYLLDQVRGQMDLPATIVALKGMAAKWPQARLKLIEEKANGPALIQLLRGQVPGLIAFNPQASKEARAQISAIAYEAGEVWLPEVQWAPWLLDFIEEHVQFPLGANDDQVDAESQLFIRWDAAEPDALERTRAQAGGLAPPRR